jgi:hypothetical protein
VQKFKIKLRCQRVNSLRLPSVAEKAKLPQTNQFTWRQKQYIPQKLQNNQHVDVKSPLCVHFIYLEWIHDNKCQLVTVKVILKHIRPDCHRRAALCDATHVPVTPHATKRLMTPDPFSIHPYLFKQNPVSLHKWINIRAGRRSLCPTHHFYTSSHLHTLSFTSLMPEFVKCVEYV